ncbi:MAG: hypothetical protein EBR01_01145 [Proteobacteria bacterium]|nr:hypothetical protein [Pseudomonadota bacterium]NBY20120.1 hypothetical protein [bacterium]
MKTWSLAFLCVLAISACNYREDKFTKTVLVDGPTFLSVSEQVFKPNCYGCHSGPSASQGIDLSDYKGLLNSGLGLISQGEPLNSTLYLNIQSGRMPPSGPRLTDAEIKMVYDWIKNGAKEN